MATKIMSSSNHTQMLKIRIKLPKLVAASQQARVLSSCFSSSSSSTSSSSYNQSGKSSVSSPTSVLPQGSESKKKRPLSPQPLLADQREVKKMKVVESSSARSTPRMSPTELRQAMVKIKFAKVIFEAQKQHLEKIITDPVELGKQLAELRRKELELKARVEAQLREEKQMADFEAKKKQGQECDQKARQLRIEWQRRRERSARDRMEAVAKSKLEQLYSCSLKEFGFMTQCDYACSWGGKHPSPLELLGLRIKEQGENHCELRRVELEEGEIVDELEEGEIR